MSKLVSGKFGDQKTPEQTLISALNSANNLQQVVIVTMDTDFDIRASYSKGYCTTHIGMLEVAKNILYSNMQED